MSNKLTVQNGLIVSGTLYISGATETSSNTNVLTYNSTTGEITYTSSIGGGGGGGTPAPSDTFIQYNSGSTFGANTTFRFIYTSQSLQQGWQTTAIGGYSHAEGFSTQALGQASHAEGGSTQAIGIYSHAEGSNTQAIGGYSHAEGFFTQAVGSGSHAEGNSTNAAGPYSHTEGLGNVAGNTASSFTINGYTTGTNGTITILGNVTSSFPIGTWVYSNAFAFPSQPTTGVSFNSGTGLTTLIFSNQNATGISGEQILTPFNANISSTPGAHAEGFFTQAVGSGSHAEGLQTIASGSQSHSEGGYTISQGDYSHAEGAYTKTIVQYSHAEGYNTITQDVIGYYGFFGSNHAEGGFTTSSATFAHAEGFSTSATQIGAHAEGATTIASGVFSHAEGANTISQGNYSHTEGSSSIAQGGFSHAEGGLTIAIGGYSHAEGHLTTASAQYSHAEGFQTQAGFIGGYGGATGLYSHTEGDRTWATADFAHAEGSQTTGSGIGSHVEGQGTYTINSYQHAQGLWNLTNAQVGAFILGNGSSNSNRKNLIVAAGNTVEITGSLNQFNSGSSYINVTTGNTGGTNAAGINFFSGSTFYYPAYYPHKNEFIFQYIGPIDGGAYNTQYPIMFKGSSGNVAIASFPGITVASSVPSDVRLTVGSNTGSVDPLNVRTNLNSDIIRVKYNGNVGINTPFPSHSLDVNGTGRFTNGLTVTSSINITNPDRTWGTAYKALSMEVSRNSIYPYFLTVTGSDSFPTYDGLPAGSPVFNISFTPTNATIAMRGTGDAPHLYIRSDYDNEIESLSYRNMIIKQPNALIVSKSVGTDDDIFVVKGVNKIMARVDAYGMKISGSDGTFSPFSHSLDVSGSGRFTNGLTITGSATITNVLTLPYQDPLPSSPATGSIALSGSGTTFVGMFVWTGAWTQI